jgi:hypothetical protein
VGACTHLYSLATKLVATGVRGLRQARNYALQPTVKPNWHLIAVMDCRYKLARLVVGMAWVSWSGSASFSSY